MSDRIGSARRRLWWLLGVAVIVSMALARSSWADTFPGGFLERDDTSVARPNLTPAALAALLPKRGLFTFPAPYDTQAIRVTNSSDCGGGDCLDLIYSYWNNMNNSTDSNTLYVLVGLDRARGGEGPTLFSYDKDTDALTDNGPLFPASSPYSYMSTEGWYFSYTKPHTIYITSGSTLQSFNVLTHAFSTIFDTTTEYPDTRLWQTSVSADGEVFSGTLENSSTYVPIGCVVYNAATQKFTLFKALGTFDECHVDMSGNYVLIDEKTPSTCSRCDEDTVIEDLETGTQTIIPNQDGGGGHYAMGYGSWVQANNWSVPNAWRWWDASQPYVQDGPLSGMGNLVQGGLVHQDLDWNVFEPSHIAWAPEPNVPITQQYACGGAYPTSLVAPHSQEITCFLLNDSVAPTDQKVLVVAPTMDDPNTDAGSWCSGCQSYTQDPKGNIDPTGRYFFFESDHGTNRMDAFIVKVPSQVLTATAGDSDGTAPSVSITSPASGASVSGTITVSADASDPAGIASVRLQLDGRNLGPALTAAPYSYTWDTAAATAGSHTLTAVATDSAGQSSTSRPVSITVQSAAASGAPKITALTANAISSSGATITWSTDQASSSQVVYGTSSAYGSYSPKLSTLATSHTVVLTGLTAGTTYHYEAQSTNSSGAEGVSSDATFTTAAASVSEPTPSSTTTHASAGGASTTASGGGGALGDTSLLLLLGVYLWDTRRRHGGGAARTGFPQA